MDGLADGIQPRPHSRALSTQGVVRQASQDYEGLCRFVEIEGVSGASLSVQPVLQLFRQSILSNCQIRRRHLQNNEGLVLAV